MGIICAPANAEYKCKVLLSFKLINIGREKYVLKFTKMLIKKHHKTIMY